MLQSLLSFGVRFSYKLKRLVKIFSYSMEYLLIKKVGLFDVNYYLAQRPDIKAAHVDPLKHYVIHGWRENVSPSPKLNDVYYRKKTESDGINPLVYYILWDSKQNGERYFGYLKQEYLLISKFIDRTLLIEPLKENAQIICEETNDKTVIGYNNDLNYPHAYIARMEDAYIVGGTRFVIKDGKLFHDEMANFSSNDYGVKAFEYFYKLSGEGKKGKLRNVKISSKNILAKGILISCEHDLNYFHWMLESIPMIMYIIENKKHYVGYPLLIPAGLHPNLKKALDEIIGKDIEVIELLPGQLIKVKKLIIPGDMTRVLDRYHGNSIVDTDVVINPMGVLRTRKKFKKGQGTKKRKIYLARHSETMRNMLNEKDIELYLLKQGFEIVDLSKVSFEFQRELFSSASIVVAPTGATLTNMVLAPENCTFVVLLSDQPIGMPQMLNGRNVMLWSQLAQICHIHYCQCNGPRAYHRNDLHDDYIIPIKKLSDILEYGGVDNG